VAYLFILKSKQLPLSTKNGQQACYKFYNIMDVLRKVISEEMEGLAAILGVASPRSLHGLREPTKDEYNGLVRPCTHLKA